MKSAFAQRVLEIVKNIPAGHTLSYGQVALLAGSPGAARAVGTLMRNNYNPAIPCHRVIRADGSLGGYNRGGSAVKAALLQEEKNNSKK